MKKTISLFLVLLIIIAALAGCGNVQTADFDDPQAVVDAFLAEHSLEGDNVADIFNDFAGKLSVSRRMKRTTRSSIFTAK